MKKFTKMSKKTKDKEENILWSNDWINIVKFEGWDVIEGHDSIICVPILEDTNQVVLRYEYIPTYKRKDGNGMYLNVISGTIEDGESPIDCLRRELVEEAGIVLRDNLPINIEDPIYVSKGCNKRYYICLLPLYKDDYYEVHAKGDGSKEEKMSKSVKVYNQDIDKLKGVDAITSLILLKIREYIR